MSSSGDSSSSDSEVEIMTKKSKTDEKPPPVKKASKLERKKKLEAEGTEEDFNAMLLRANQIKNKVRRREAVLKALKLKKKLKRKERDRRQKEAEGLGEEAPARKVPHTIDSLREKEVSTVIDGDLETNYDMSVDEFTSYYNRSYEPKILITSSDNPTLKTRLFLRELSRIIPNSEVFLRRQSKVKKITDQAIEKGFTDVIVVNEHHKIPRSLLISHLPEGPTAFFRLSNVQLTKHIKRDWREITSHKPEVILSNFSTRLGFAIGRLFASLFNQSPQFKGRRVATFHNQRDYIFFRHHRYEFKKEGKKAALRELGPRFTLKLKSLQKGTFDSRTGEYEWIITNRRHEMETSRRKFFL